MGVPELCPELSDSSVGIPTGERQCIHRPSTSSASSLYKKTHKLCVTMHLVYGYGTEVFLPRRAVVQLCAQYNTGRLTKNGAQ
eukprot:182049-Rhodomonas_salina.1